MAKSDDDQHLSEIVEDLIANVADDRDRLSNFIDELIKSYSGESIVGIAEYVAKLFDAATRQHQVKVAIVKALVKKPASEESDDSIDSIVGEIGLPFKDDAEDGSN